MTLKEFRIQRALGTAECSYSIKPDNFFGRIEFDNISITIPYWLFCDINSVIDRPYGAYTLVFNYIETQLS